MSENNIYAVDEAVAARAHLTAEQYVAMYRQSVDDPHGFWAQQATQLVSWSQPWDTVLTGDFAAGEARWFDGARLNVCYNCVDRHLKDRGDQVAIIWEGDEISGDGRGENRRGENGRGENGHGGDMAVTYNELHELVCRFANVLKSRGVKKGDRVAIYMPMVVEAAVAMLACARIGAVHSVVFAGFSPEALRDRILDSDCRVVITADEGMRAGKSVPLKANVEAALAGCAAVHTVIVVRRDAAVDGGQTRRSAATSEAAVDGDVGDVGDHAGRDVFWDEAMWAVSNVCPPTEMEAEDALFILYTSGSTGKPKGVLHTSGGYLLYAACTHKYVFDYHDGEVFWCTADVGWVTGHSYVVYGPLANGATTLMFEGVPTYPDGGRFWQIIDKHKVNIFYTAPTALRALMRLGDEWVKRANRKSLRVLGSVGEPINPQAWEWYFEVVGDGRCPIVDTWWQTETGGILITPLPGATALKPGSATRPFFGVVPAIMDADGNEIDGAASGNLVIKQAWPGQMRTIYGDHARFVETYFKTYAGAYFSGDGARRDEDGYWWITGRVDDVINVSGHRMGTAEVESALVLHAQVAEAAVVGFPHEIKGQGIYAFVTTMVGVDVGDGDGAGDEAAAAGEKLRQELLALVRQEIGAIAKPDVIQWAPGLPKTRSGKIMRRILRKVAANELDNLGDISTLAEPAVVADLIAHRVKYSG